MSEPVREPHHPLNQPAESPDPTEWPDPYDKRPDPLAPEAATAEDRGARLGATSTSEPHPHQDPEAIEL